MENSHIMVSLCIIFIFLLSFSLDANSAAIIKKLPGFHGDLPFTLESGYVGVGAENEVQIFYYFVESQKDPLHDPLLLYLTGGPGTTGLYPLLFQIGPLSVNFDNSTWNKLALELNRNSWAKMANVIFIDLPVGVGFSYATTYEASKSSDSMSAQHAYKFLIKWLEEYPRFLNNPLYISGISYMGIFVPPVTLEVYKGLVIRGDNIGSTNGPGGNERGDHPHLDIKGCIIVSPLTDKFSDYNSKFEFAHRIALISDDIYESAKETCRGNYVNRDPENIECSISLQRMDECTSRINPGNILYPYCDIDDVDLDPTCLESSKKYLEYYGNDKQVQTALHIREGTIEKFEMTNQTIHYDLNKEDNECYSYDIFSTIDYHQMLVSRNCQALIISGDHDFTFPFVGAEQWIQSLNLPIESPWNPWFVNKQVAGYRTKYAKNGYSLTHATVKGAGHSIALYKPELAWVIVNEWLASHSYLSDS